MICARSLYVRMDIVIRNDLALIVCVLPSSGSGIVGAKECRRPSIARVCRLFAPKPSWRSQEGPYDGATAPIFPQLALVNQALERELYPPQVGYPVRD